MLLCGPSGGGKSTLLRACLGLVPQLSGGTLAGQITACGLDPSRVPPAKVAAAGVTLVFQNPVEGFVAGRVAAEVAFGPENLGLERPEVAARVDESLAQAGIASLRDAHLTSLSTGQQQRVAIAAALAMRPRLLLLDEPTAHVDPETAAGLLRLLAEIRTRTGVAILIAEHRLELAAPLADRVVVVAAGRVVADGAPRSVFADGSLVELGVPVPRAALAAARLGGDGPLALTADELAARASPKNAVIVERVASPQRGAAVRFSEVSFRYPGSPADAVRGISFTVGSGEVVALVGPSGAGKTTLARLALGLIRPSAGAIELRGQRIDALSPSALAARAGLVLQNPLHQLFAERVDDEISLGLRHLPVAERRVRLAEALESFGLTEVADRHPLTLSEGERRRTALAATLARGVDVLVLDEPTLGQDELQRRTLTTLLRRLAAGGAAILAIGHDPEFMNDACDRVVALRDGVVVADLPLGGDPATVGALDAAGVTLAQVPATVRALALRGLGISARTVDELVAALR